MSKWLTSKEFREKYRLSSGALWARVNTQKTVKTKVMYNKTFYLDEDDAVNNEDRVNVVYCRVADEADRVKLDKQVEVITEYCLKAGKKPDVVLSEVGSGYDNDREKFKDLIRMIVEGKVDVLFIAMPEILSIDSFELIKSICDICNVELEILNYRIVKTDNEIKANFSEMLKEYSDLIPEHKKEIENLANLILS